MFYFWKDMWLMMRSHNLKRSWDKWNWPTTNPTKKACLLWVPSGETKWLKHFGSTEAIIPSWYCFLSFLVVRKNQLGKWLGSILLSSFVFTFSISSPWINHLFHSLLYCLNGKKSLPWKTTKNTLNSPLPRKINSLGRTELWFFSSKITENWNKIVNMLIKVENKQNCVLF